MPVHDWKTGYRGVFHSFHQIWISRIMETVNRELPRGYYALVEQNATGIGKRKYEADLLTLKKRDFEDFGTQNAMGVPGGAAVVSARPKATIEARIDQALYTRKKSRIAIRHRSGNRVIALIEVVSPGNKNRRLHLNKFVDKVVDMLDRGVHLTLVDPFPPGKYDPRGIHAAIWESFDGAAEQPFDPTKPLTAAGYRIDDMDNIDAFVEPFALGDRIPDMPVFLSGETHVVVPFEETYTSAWNALPIDCREMVERGMEL
jgi:hypothetical protein